MTFHPLLTLFGRLEMVEVYDIYDRPVLFTCRNDADTRYLVVLVEENAADDVWMYAEVSPTRLNRIRTGIIDLHTAFTQTETYSIWRIRMPHDPTAPVQWDIKPCHLLPLSEVPLPGEFITIPVHTAPALVDDLDRRAAQARRDFARFGFDFNTTLATEAPVKPLGLIFASIQDIVHSLASMLNTQFKGIVPQEIPREHQLVFEAAGAGSFEVQIASYAMGDLFGQSDVGRALDELMTVIEIRDDEDALQERLAILKANVTAKYLIFLRHLRDYVAYTHILWVSPSGTRRDVSLNNPLVGDIIRIIEKSDQSSDETFDIEGILIGANLDSKTFVIKTTLDNKKTLDYSGKVSESGMKALTYAQLSSHYRATIKKTSTFHPITGKIEELKELIALTRMD